jgi:hypothetical protein
VYRGGIRAFSNNLHGFFAELYVFSFFTDSRNAALWPRCIKSIRRKEIMEGKNFLQGYPQSYVPLYQETRQTVNTATAAFHLDRQAQTLRVWASRETGPIRPIRVNGRLAWPVADLKKLLGVAQ